MNKTELLDRCARSGEERTLLARVLDKLELAQNRGVPAWTPFLTPGEQASAGDLLAAWGGPRYLAAGGYEGSERNILYFPPDWQEPEDALADPEGPLAALEGTFPGGASLTHRDILGSLMGLGITREKLGDILILEGKCQVVALREALPILLSQWESAGRGGGDPPVRPHPQTAHGEDRPGHGGRPAAGRGAGRRLLHLPVQGGSAGRVAVNHRECMKGDRTVAEGDVLTCRGLGKCVVKEVLGASRKGRIMLVLERYV